MLIDPQFAGGTPMKPFLTQAPFPANPSAQPWQDLAGDARILNDAGIHAARRGFTLVELLVVITSSVS